LGKIKKATVQDNVMKKGRRKGSGFQGKKRKKIRGRDTRGERGVMKGG